MELASVVESTVRSCDRLSSVNGQLTSSIPCQQTLRAEMLTFSQHLQVIYVSVPILYMPIT